jgi:hypothetical protein
MSNSHLPEEEIEHLRTRLRIELREELEEWGKKRFWWVVIVAGIISIIGINSVIFPIVQGMLEKDVHDLKEQARQSIIEVKVAADLAEETVARSQKDVEKAKEIQRSIESLKRADSVTLQSRIDELKMRLEQLETQIMQIRMSYEIDLEHRKSVEKSVDNEAIDNGLFPVWILYATSEQRDQRKAEIQALQDAGFKTVVQVATSTPGLPKSLEELGKEQASTTFIPSWVFNKHKEAAVVCEPVSIKQAKEVRSHLLKVEGLDEIPLEWVWEPLRPLGPGGRYRGVIPRIYVYIHAH